MIVVSLLYVSYPPVGVLDANPFRLSLKKKILSSEEQASNSEA